jgi:hypothetical protein
MYRASVELAITKASSAAEKSALLPVLSAARALDEEERTFPDRIEANKALRGEGPTKLSRRKRKDVDAYAEDARVAGAEQLAQFSELESAASILSCLKAGLDADIAFWSKAHEKAHPSDAPLVIAFTQAKVSMRAAIVAFVAARFGP